MLRAKTCILIVEDDALIRTLLSEVLVGLGYTVRSASDGFSALVEISNGVPDIILSDLNMPGMSGVELLKVVCREFPAIRRIAMSGSFSGENVPPGVAADAFYSKGSNPACLLHVVEAVIPKCLSSLSC